MPTAPNPSVYQLKVTLLGTRPPIWRRLLVLSSMTLAHLHATVQLAMGWTDSHLHEFEIEGLRYGPPSDDNFEPQPVSENTPLSRVMKTKGAEALYTYDFGDGWEHNILVEKILPASDDLELPACTAGKQRCPPEDCGGLHGYYTLLNIITDPSHDEHESMIEWLGGEAINPAQFSVEEANAALKPVRKTRRPTKAAAASLKRKSN